MDGAARFRYTDQEPGDNIQAMIVALLALASSDGADLMAHPGLI